MWITKPGAKILEFGDQRILASTNPASLGGFEVPGQVWLDELRHEGWQIMDPVEAETWKGYARELDQVNGKPAPKASAQHASKVTAKPAAKPMPKPAPKPVSKAAPAPKAIVKRKR
jgi:hypothetical protein